MKSLSLKKKLTVSGSIIKCLKSDYSIMYMLLILKKTKGRYGRVKIIIMYQNGVFFVSFFFFFCLFGHLSVCSVLNACLLFYLLAFPFPGRITLPQLIHLRHSTLCKTVCQSTTQGVIHIKYPPSGLQNRV